MELMWRKFRSFQSKYFGTVTGRISLLPESVSMSDFDACRRGSPKNVPSVYSFKRRSGMADQMLLEPVELTDAELDMVAGGLALAGGLVNIPVNITLADVNILSQHGIDVTVGDISIKNIANNNNIGVGAVIQALGGVA